MKLGILFPKNHGSLWGSLTALESGSLGYFDVGGSPLLSRRWDYYLLRRLGISVDGDSADLLWAHPPCGSKTLSGMGYFKHYNREKQIQQSLGAIQQAKEAVLRLGPRWWIIESSPNWIPELEIVGRELSDRYAVSLVADLEYYDLGFWLRRQRTFLIGGPAYLTHWWVPQPSGVEEMIEVLSWAPPAPTPFVDPGEYPPLGKLNQKVKAWRPAPGAAGFLSSKRESIIHPVEDRPLTATELAYWYGHPGLALLWEARSSKASLYRLLFNRGVPPSAAYWTTRSIALTTAVDAPGFRTLSWQEVTKTQTDSSLETYRKLVEAYAEIPAQ